MGKKLLNYLPQRAKWCRWSNAAYVLNEVRRPVRTLKIAGPLGLGICGVLYLLANVSYFAAATPKEIASSGNTIAAHFFHQVFGKAAGRVLRYYPPKARLGVFSDR